MVPRVVGTLAAAVLVGLGALHCYWAAGGRWATDVTIPKHDGAPLFTPAPVATLLVAVLLYAAALVLLGRLGIWGRWLPRWLFVVGTWTLVVVFGGRVVGDFQWFGLFKRVTGTPFAWWDTWVYVPLCMLLALAALFIAVREP
ncbi:MAG: DUF3995 domain-containing protein [Deltaproteobacteria bacterium]|nr:DUF3995 domain-containing protein [Deltaproteobacteria bacterium]